MFQSEAIPVALDTNAGIMKDANSQGSAGSNSVIVNDTSAIRKRKRTSEPRKVIPMPDLPLNTFLSYAGFQGPTVDVYLKSNPTKKYILSKELLCARSDFFDACFNGSFKEATTQAVHLDEDVKVKPFEMLLRWLFTGNESTLPAYFKIVNEVPVSSKAYKDYDYEKLPQMRPYIEFTKKLDELHDSISDYLDFILLCEGLLFTPGPSGKIAAILHYQFRNTEIYIHDWRLYPPLLSEHIQKAWQLSSKDPIRRLFSQMAVHVYLEKQESDFPYDADLVDVEGFAKDVLATLTQKLSINTLPSDFEIS